MQVPCNVSQLAWWPTTPIRGGNAKCGATSPHVPLGFAMARTKLTCTFRAGGNSDHQIKQRQRNLRHAHSCWGDSGLHFPSGLLCTPLQAPCDLSRLACGADDPTRGGVGNPRGHVSARVFGALRWRQRNSACTCRAAGNSGHRSQTYP